MRAVFLLCLVSTVALSQPAWDTIPNLPDHYRKRVALFKKQKLITGRVMMVGNSITEGGNWRKLTGDTTVINRGVSGDITFGLLQRVADITARKPSKLFLLIGINDLSKKIPEEVILQNILTFVRQVQATSAGTQIFVQSILPVNPGFKNFPPGYDVGAAVLTINGQLQKISSRFQFTFVDLHSAFTDKDGLLHMQYSNDGLHLNEAGYQRWVKVLKDAKHL
jgi:lysophospholipase L1-like esterase